MRASTSCSRCARASARCSIRSSGWRSSRCSWRWAAAATSKTCRPRRATRPKRARRWRCSPSAPSQADTLAQENARLRSLLELRQTTQTPGRAAEVLYDAADPYTRKLVIDQGLTNGIAPGSPVIDEHGVLGQVTQVQPFTQRDHAGDRPRPRPSPCRTCAPARAAWPSATPAPTAAGSSCASWRPTPTCRRATCSPPAASTASTRRGCRWPRSTASSAAPTPPSRASTACRWPT